VGYSGSDLCIPRLVAELEGASRHSVLLSVCLAYIVCGAVGGLLLTRHRAQVTLEAQVYALPCSIAWLAAMCCLFACFELIGLVFGNMLQAARGPVTVAIGALIGRLGLLHIDTVYATRGRLARRLLGALAMAAAIVLYLAAS